MKIYRYAIVMILIHVITVLVTFASAQSDEGKKQETIPAIPASNNYFNINRLQFRKSFERGDVLTETSFIRFPNKLFLFGHIEYWDNGYYFSDIYAGQPFSPSHTWGKSFGWVVRTEAGKSQRAIYSAGGIWYISDTPSLAQLLKKVKLETFLEIFPVKSNNQQGSTDFLLHYAFPITKGLSVRGYNRIYLNTDEGTIFYAVQDLIYSFSKRIDVYIRDAYQNRNAFHQIKGSEISLGVRYNFVF